MDITDAIIRLADVGKVFQTANGEVKALEHINLDIKAGEIFGIIGLSGAGKSTLVRCMNFLEEPTSGEVLFEGKSLASLSNAELAKVRQSMSMIFQQFNLLSQRNILQNVCFPMEIAGFKKEERQKRALELLNMVGLGDRAKAYPAQLSGGQKQRVAIARALATNPKVLLCDEATSALDPNTTKSILTLLKQINQELGITVIVITHEMAVIESICDRVAIIDKSQIAELGTVAEIFSGPKSKIGRQLIFGGAVKNVDFGEAKRYRILFDGLSSHEPVISNMVLACKVPVNILYAATRDINGMAVGQMIVQVPQNPEDAERVLRYLKGANIPYEEVGNDV
ncbi:MAG: ATP-binding cassette domain-containing protein [bacterium]|nr:ATP-binding cassette domain-containing protein [bacterium]